jgi:hypothetical protein
MKKGKITAEKTKGKRKWWEMRECPGLITIRRQRDRHF